MSEQAGSQVRVERSPKRVRVYLEGDLVADTYAPLLVWENSHYPAYYIPAADVRAELIPAGESEHKARFGDGELLHVKTSLATAELAARRYADSPVPELRDSVRLEWAAMTEWLEEDEPIYKHPRSPYTRIDILASSRQVRVELDGVTVAESSQPRILFETGLPARYYLPPRRPAAQGRRLDLPDAAARKPEDRWPGSVLQRARRAVRGRRQAAEAEVTV